MKKITIYFITIWLALTTYLLQAKPNELSIKVTQTEQAKNLVSRLNEIKAMDKSGLNKKDKKKLYTEVIAIQNQLKPLDGGIYISVAGAIIILLLLILIF